MSRITTTVLVILVMVVSTGIYSMAGASDSQGYGKVPSVNITTIGFGNEQFELTENFSNYNGNVEKNQESSEITISQVHQDVSLIGDQISSNYSVTISTKSIELLIHTPNGALQVSSPPGHSYLASLSLTGNSSFPYVTVVEEIPSSTIGTGGTLNANGEGQLALSSVYNLTVEYNNSKFNLIAPGFVSIGGQPTQVSLSISSEDGVSIVSISFPVTDGNFSFAYYQVLSSGSDINPTLESYYNLTGFNNKFVSDLISNAYSLLIGVAIFLVILAGLFLYYRRK